MMRRLAVASATLVAALGLVVGGGALAASAHDQLSASDPATGSSVNALSTVTLRYSDTVIELGDAANVVEVTDAAGLHYETGCTVVDGAELSVPVALGEAGDYTVTWRAVSADGHPITGDFAFTYTGDAVGTGTEETVCGAPAEPTEEPTAEPTEPTSEPTATTEPPSVGQPQPTEQPADWTPAIVAGGALGVLAVVIAVVLLLTGRRRDDD